MHNADIAVPYARATVLGSVPVTGFVSGEATLTTSFSLSAKSQEDTEVVSALMKHTESTACAKLNVQQVPSRFHGSCFLCASQTN